MATIQHPTRRESLLLLGAYESLQTIRNTNDGPEGDAREFWIWAEARTLAAEWMVATNPTEWLGEPLTPSLRTMVSRAYKKLEAAGLVIRVNYYGEAKTTHLQLTDAGRSLAQSLLQKKDEENGPA